MAQASTAPHVLYRPQRVTSHRRCVVCGRMKYCAYDPIAGVAFCTKTPSDNGKRYGDWGFIHRVDATPTEYNAHLAQTSRPEVVISDEEAAARDVLYSEMARFCTIETDAFIDLTSRRKMSAAQVKRRGYFSYPAHTGALMAHLEVFATTSTAARRWNKAHPDLSLDAALHRLPGHYTKGKRGRSGGYSRHLAGDRALGIPVRNARGETIAIRLRVDAADSATGKKEVKWLSAQLTKSGSPLHVARPETLADARVWITEGEIKADIASDKLGAVVLSIPGITAWQGKVEATLDAVKATIQPVQEVVIALDQDAATETRALVQTQASAIARELIRLGYTVSIATWAAEDGKGLDDLLVAGGSPVIVPFAQPRMRGVVPAAPTTYGADAALVPYADAELQLQDIAKQIFPSTWPRGVKSMETFILLATMGLGKTFNLMTRLDMLDRFAGAWPQVWNAKSRKMRDVRVLILFDDVKILAEQTHKYLNAVWVTDQYEEHGEPKSRQVWDRAATGRASLFIMEGRNPAPHSGGYCANPMAGEVSGRRGLPIADVCRVGKDTPCPFAQNCAYLASKKLVKDARIVCACKSAYLTESKELEDFDLVIMDEDTASAFLEQIDISAGDVDQWRRLLVERDQGGQFSDLEQFLGWWQEALAHAKAHGAGQLFPALPHFRATAPANALALLHQARRAAEWNDGGKGREFYRAICEMIWPDDRAIPLRALHDVTDGLIAEWERDPEADTRLRFTEAGTLNYRHPRQALIERLFARRVAMLDATGDMALLRRIQQTATAHMAAPVPFTVLRVQVAHTIRLTQISDSLYGRKSLAKDGGVQWHAIEETVGALAAKVGISPKQVARLTYKLFDPNDATSETAGDDTFVTGHYGLDNKATNRFYDDDIQCRMLVTIGNYTPNIGEIAATVEAWRFSPAPRQVGSHDETICYPGKAQGAVRPVHNDPDIQAAIRHATWAAETQALGRMRDVRRPGEVIHWVRFNRDPYIPPGPDHQAVPVAALMTHNHLRKQLGLAPVEVFSAKQRAPLSQENARRRAEAEAKCSAAAEVLTAEGKELTANAIATRAGVNYNRAKAWLDAQQPKATNAKTRADAPKAQPVNPAVVPTPPPHFTRFNEWHDWYVQHGVEEQAAIAYTLAHRPQPVYQGVAS